MVPQIRSLMPDKFEELLNPLEKTAWQTFKYATHRLLGNRKAKNYPDILNERLTSDKIVACNMSFKPI